jgi:hypothetical protein
MPLLTPPQVVLDDEDFHSDQIDLDTLDFKVRLAHPTTQLVGSIVNLLNDTCAFLVFCIRAASN